LNIVLRARRLDFTVSEPLSWLVKAGSDSNWCATWSEIWKWIRFGDGTEPMLPCEGDIRVMMAEEELSAKGGG
jgi:hypothetical protein